MGPMWGDLGKNFVWPKSKGGGAPTRKWAIQAPTQKSKPFWRVKISFEKDQKGKSGVGQGALWGR